MRPQIFGRLRVRQLSEAGHIVIHDDRRKTNVHSRIAAMDWFSAQELGPTLPEAKAMAGMFAASPEMAALLKECADYLGCIPESAAGGDDAAVDLYRRVQRLLSSIEAP
jgi:hypothetical protein